jgi:Tfp pilus assembly protein PilP
VVGVLTGTREPQALVQLPDGQLFRLAPGSCVGKASGRVSRIDRERVVVEEPAAGEAGTVERVIELR